MKSKRWPLGVKQLLDINAPPPSDAEGDGGDGGDDEVQVSRYGKLHFHIQALILLSTLCICITLCFQFAVFWCVM